MNFHLRLALFVVLAFAMCLLPGVLAYFLLPQTNLGILFGIVGIFAAIKMIANVQKQIDESNEDPSGHETDEST